MFAHICMLTQVYELLIAQLHIFSIDFINVLSNYRCIRYLVFPALFWSISMVGLVGFVALRPKSTAMVIAGRSVHLTTLFPGQS